MSITFEKCIDITACVNNYFWPWQCAITAFLRLLFAHIFSFSCKASRPSFYSFVHVAPLPSADLLLTFRPWPTLFYPPASMYGYMYGIPTFLFANPILLHFLKFFSMLQHFPPTNILWVSCKTTLLFIFRTYLTYLRTWHTCLLYTSDAADE